MQTVAIAPNSLNDVTAKNSALISHILNNPRNLATPQFGLVENGTKLAVLTTISGANGEPITTTDFWALFPDNTINTAPGLSFKYGNHLEK